MSALRSLSPDLAFPLIDGAEDSDAWECYRAPLVADLQPVGSVELDLAETIARLGWRLRRFERLEAEALAGGFVRQFEEIDALPGRGKTTARERLLAWITRHEGHLDRARYRARKELRTLQKERRAIERTAPSEMPRDTEDPKLVQTPGGETVGSFGQRDEPFTREPVPVSSNLSEGLASYGQNVGADDHAGSEPGVSKEIPETKPTPQPDQTEAGAVGSFGHATGPPPQPVPESTTEGTESIGRLSPAEPGAAGSFGQKAESTVPIPPDSTASLPRGVSQGTEAFCAPAPQPPESTASPPSSPAPRPAAPVMRAWALFV